MPLFPELIKEIRSYLPKQWVLYKKGKYKFKEGQAVRIEKIDYGELRSICNYNVPPDKNCVGKIISLVSWELNHPVSFYDIDYNEDDGFLNYNKYLVQFLRPYKKHYGLCDKCKKNNNLSCRQQTVFVLDKKTIKPVNFPDKKKIIINKKNIITET